MGTLFVVATPIGNLNDFSQRGLQTLRDVDLIACEDTRQTIKLLNHFGIQKPLTSYHEFNEEQKAAELLKHLMESKAIALVSDAGTPAIADPGYRLVRLCRQNSIPVVAIPGPSAASAALSVSGLPSDEFMFSGLSTIQEERAPGKAVGCSECELHVDLVRNTASNRRGSRRYAGCIGRSGGLHCQGNHKNSRRVPVRCAIRSEKGCKADREFVIVVHGATEIRTAAPVTREDVLRTLGMTRNQLYDLFFKK
jgi:hypothetical protein